MYYYDNHNFQAKRGDMSIVLQRNKHVLRNSQFKSMFRNHEVKINHLALPMITNDFSLPYNNLQQVAGTSCDKRNQIKSHT